jgi:hypothetical protein
MAAHKGKSKVEKVSQKYSEEDVWALFAPPGRGKSIIDFDDLDQERQNLGVGSGTEIDSYELPKE